MTASKKQALIGNVLFWIVGALIYPLASIVPTGSGEPPKIFSLLIPIFFIMLAYCFGCITVPAPSRDGGASIRAG